LHLKIVEEVSEPPAGSTEFGIPCCGEVRKGQEGLQLLEGTLNVPRIGLRHGGLQDPGGPEDKDLAEDRGISPNNAVQPQSTQRAQRNPSIFKTLTRGTTEGRLGKLFPADPSLS
jgi:hypothetical protein